MVIIQMFLFFVFVFLSTVVSTCAQYLYKKWRVPVLEELCAVHCHGGVYIFFSFLKINIEKSCVVYLLVNDFQH